MSIKGMKKALFLIMCLVLVAGCTSNPGSKEPEQQSLRVMFWDENYFFQQYGDLFAMQHPNIEIEVVSTNNIYRDMGPDGDYDKAFKDFIDKEQPDVLMVSIDQMETYISEGKIRELDTLIERDKYSIDTIYPALIELLKERGDNKIYGLTPNFYGSAILYNADLFAKHGVELPRDGMSWYDIIELAKQFPTEGDEKTRIYGFDNNWGINMMQLASMISSSEGIEQIDTNSMKLTLNTESWKKIYQTALDAMKSNVFYNPGEDGFRGGSMEEYYQSQPFVMGRAAMTTGDTYVLRNLKEAADALKDYKPFEVGIVAGPASSTDPDKSRNISVSEVFAISANSPNADAAWEFIKFVNGDQFAKIKSRSLNNGLLSRMGYTDEYNGISLEAYYKLKPLPTDYSGMRKIPNGFYEKFQPLLDTELKAVEDNTKSLDEALAKIEAEGQVALDQALKEQEEKKKEEEAQGGSSEGSADNSAGTTDSSEGSDGAEGSAEDSASEG
ncbi:extracellular solute-binding protein [Paenibacillus woosongensis]|uniref:Extracellular solute-binding protein n=1 Tax=Paenibacillus woosongensis TaxID=307580 RepID=A0AA95I8T9_9BACL|nr:extracellular solute-binding protein [Paenibacillus woosongensis]WHX48647.1 extracellular solute-binding protein [Paenibacillus woosongensis]